MRQRVAYVAVILVGMGLLVWLVLGTRYHYFENNQGDALRDDGWTGIRQVLRCEERPADHSIFSATSLTTAPTAGTQEPLSPSGLDRLNQTRQERHLPKIDKWGHELVRTCRWVNG